MNELFVDNLTVIDFAYLDARRGLVGESWIVDLVLGGELDEQGMVFDFSGVKRTIKRVIDDVVDHRLAVPLDYAGLSRPDGDPHSFCWTLSSGERIQHSGPDEAVVFVPGDRILPSAVAALLQEALREVLPANVRSIELQLREDEIDGAYYHYVHGLKKHRGNCQRIAHGHRSPLKIWRAGRRDRALEQQWARRWADIYLASEEDVAYRSVEAGGTAYLTFKYHANQGEFALTMPERQVYRMTTDTTVEWIAAHLADQCKADYPDDDILVRAYEGVGKGAMARR